MHEDPYASARMSDTKHDQVMLAHLTAGGNKQHYLATEAWQSHKRDNFIDKD